MANAPILARVQHDNRINIPREVADHLGIRTGDVVLFRLLAKGRATVALANVTAKA